MALSYLLLSDHFLNNGIHTMRETFAMPLSLLSLYVVLMMTELPFRALDIVLITFSMVVSFSHPRHRHRSGKLHVAHDCRRPNCRSRRRENSVTGRHDYGSELVPVPESSVLGIVCNDAAEPD